jgi:CelD/BcsL family acetyltransferase involved in cellulose biosynthesis
VLWVLVVREGSDLLAVAPLWLETRRVLGVPLRIARWIGDGPSDYGDFLLATLEPALAETLAGHLLGRRSCYDVLDLRECRGDSPALPWQRAALALAHRGLRGLPDSQCFVLPMEAGWDAYTNRQFSGKRRKDLRREERKLAMAGGFEWITLTAIERASDLADAFGAVQAAHVAASDARPGEYNDPVFRPFMETMIETASRKGWLRAFLLRRHGQVVAFLLAFAYRGRHYLYTTAHTADSQQFGAGKLLFLHAMESMFGEGDGTIDFLRGAETYKEMLTDRSTTNMRLRSAGLFASWMWFDLMPRVEHTRSQRVAAWVGEHGVGALGSRILQRLRRRVPG